jgi:hypothetical protein
VKVSKELLSKMKYKKPKKKIPDVAASSFDDVDKKRG